MLTVKWTFPLLIGVTLALSGCMEVSLLSKDKSFMGHDSMVIDPPRKDILDVIADVGKSMKLDVSALDRASGTITLESGIKTLEFIGIGKASTSDLTIATSEGGKKLDIQVLVTGNFGTGGQKAADKLVNAFKAKLKERLSTKTESPK